MARSKRAAPVAAPAPVVGRPDEGRVFQAPKAAQRPIDEALAATPAKVAAIFAEARQGRTRRIVDLGKSARRYDSRLNSVASTRVIAVGSRPYAIKPPPGYDTDATAKRIVEFVTRHFHETRNFPTLKEHLAHGALETHAVLEHLWSENARGEVRTQPVWRHPNRFAWLQDGPNAGEIGKLDPGVDSAPSPLSGWPNKFVVHSAVAGQSDYPWERGALRPRLLPSIAKRKGVVWWLSAIERYGQPQIVATVRDGDNTELVANVIASLRNLGPDWRAVVPEGVTLEELAVTINPDLHAKFVDAMNVEDAVALLGQNLSTEVKGGSYAAAKSQERVRADILAADLAELDETITDQWIRPLVVYNFGEGAPVPYIEHTLESRTPFTIADAQAGLCTVDQYLADTGHDPEPNGTGKRYLLPVGTPAGTAAPGAVGATDPNAAPVADAAPNGAQQQALGKQLADVAAGLLAPGAAVIAISKFFAAFFTPEEVQQMVDAQVALPPPPVPGSTPGAPVTTTQASAAATPPDELKLIPGDIWTDTTDTHRIKIVMQVGQKLYLVDLDAENPSQQFSWTVTHFLEICTPPASAIPSAPGGAPAALPLPSTPSASPTSSTSPQPINPMRSALLRR